MDTLFIAALAIWFSGRALYLGYRSRGADKAIADLTFEIEVLVETLNYAQETLEKTDPRMKENLVEFFKKTHQRCVDDLE